MTDFLTVVHCEGWDPARRAIVGRLPVAVAQERDRTGEQYAFCLVEPASGRVVRVGEIAWEVGFARLWFLDAQGRRERVVEYRGYDGRLFLLSSRQWTYTTPDQVEFDESAAYAKQLYLWDGRSECTVMPQGSRGGSTRTQREADEAERFRGYPEFPDWATFAEVPADVTLVVEDPAEESAEPPWSPAGPLTADSAAAAFFPGRLWSLSGEAAVTELIRAGTARMPTGQVIAADPGMLDDDLKPFVTSIPPGDYPVELGIIRFEARPEFVRVTAAKLVVSTDPVVSWEPALTAGQDPQLLGVDEFYGFGVDGGMGCFFDAAALSAFERINDSRLDERCLINDVGTTAPAVVPDPESGATLVAYTSGWGDGSYPTWIGRTASGEVACFVSDMLVLQDGAPFAEEVVGTPA